ncbi:hypothetical protein [Aurantiacibacter hainanensis]|uniref:hypothetical protein n=1 Tax=Aurantiacibacter hainanensis TaxID=3076114 RepID=UPI0030C6B9D9
MRTEIDLDGAAEAGIINEATAIALLAMLPKRLEAQFPRTYLRLQGQRPTRRRAPMWPSKPGKSL